MNTFALFLETKNHLHSKRFALTLALKTRLQRLQGLSLSDNREPKNRLFIVWNSEILLESPFDLEIHIGLIIKSRQGKKENKRLGPICLMCNFFLIYTSYLNNIRE